MTMKQTGKGNEVAEVAVEGGAEEEAERSSIGGVTCPPEMRTMIEQVCKEQNKPARQFVREVVAQAVGYKGPLGKTIIRKTGLSEEERKEANRQKGKARREMFANLLKKYSPEELKALIESK